MCLPEGSDTILANFQFPEIQHSCVRAEYTTRIAIWTQCFMLTCFTAAVTTGLNVTASKYFS
jgi:hypothetical protein